MSNENISRHYSSLLKSSLNWQRKVAFKSIHYPHRFFFWRRFCIACPKDRKKRQSESAQSVWRDQKDRTTDLPAVILVPFSMASHKRGAESVAAVPSFTYGTSGKKKKKNLNKAYVILSGGWGTWCILWLPLPSTKLNPWMARLELTAWHSYWIFWSSSCLLDFYRRHLAWALFDTIRLYWLSTTNGTRNHTEGLLMLCNLHFYWVKMLIDHFTGQRWGSPNKLHSTLIHSNVTMRFWVLPRPVARTNWEACWKSGENTTENTAGLGWLGVRGMSQHPAGTNRTRASWCRPDLETRKSCKDRGWLNLAIPLKNHPRGKNWCFLPWRSIQTCEW